MSFLIKDNRLNEWAVRKKAVEAQHHINFDSAGKIKFRIRPWSVWWFEIGENIGTETGSHFDPLQMSTKRPCVVVSNNNFIQESYNTKVVIMPLTSKKPTTRVKHFHFELFSGLYLPVSEISNRMQYDGLEKDSLVICNDIKTIDTKRLIKAIYPKLHQSDIDGIKVFLRRYF
ncbi:type II toxin-antitoxin system PemK/MazF family toxin [Sulfurimonas sp.]|uniref:type II toxin-antitoxin system PemK/MazF family toxin n=1 Tax=Sulfurimonas sp. TaxID=2022749 RepID=UPI0025D86061|nr:type II toxin-antitoxin system PemK/MazF family toxin [Sulfurimonas sp.]